MLMQLFANYLRQELGRYFVSTVVAALVQLQLMLPPLSTADKAKALPESLLLADGPDMAAVTMPAVMVTLLTYLPEMEAGVAGRPAEALFGGKLPWFA